MLILDACVGSAKMYKGREKLLKDNFISIDIRKGDFTYKPNKNRKLVAPIPLIIKPTVLASLKFLPFKNKIFDSIIIDPPHLNQGKNSYATLAYGSWSESERVSSIYKANIEFNRVLKDNGMIILKILPEKINSYESLFSNFIFYLPIQTIRDRGCFTSKEAKESAIWLIGIKKDNI